MIRSHHVMVPAALAMLASCANSGTPLAPPPPKLGPPPPILGLPVHLPPAATLTALQDAGYAIVSVADRGPITFVPIGLCVPTPQPHDVAYQALFDAAVAALDDRYAAGAGIGPGSPPPIIISDTDAKCHPAPQ
jgi:hypothetical protein